MSHSVLQSDLFVAGSLSSRTFTAPSGSITNDSIQAVAGIDATKLDHQHVVRYSQKAGTAVVAETVPVHIAYAAGELIAVEVVCLTHPTSSDTVAVDVKVGNASSAFATVLTGTIDLDSSSVDRTVYTGTIATGDYDEGDIFEVVTTVSGTSCQGLVVTLVVRENAE